jgi:hypothetical protein
MSEVGMNRQDDLTVVYYHANGLNAAVKAAESTKHEVLCMQRIPEAPFFRELTHEAESYLVFFKRAIIYSEKIKMLINTAKQVRVSLVGELENAKTIVEWRINNITKLMHGN